jgi:hypothetical protein
MNPKIITKQQIETILKNAPTGTDKTKLLDNLILKGYDLEGTDSNAKRQQLQTIQTSQQTTTQQSNVSKYDIAMGNKNPDGTPNTDKGIIPQAFDQAKAGFQQTVEGAKNPDLLAGLQQIGRGTLNEMAGGLRAVFSPLEAGLKIVSQLPGFHQALGALQDYVINPTANVISDNKHIQDFMQSNPHADEIFGNLLAIIGSIVGGKMAPEIKSVTTATTDSLGNTINVVKTGITDKASAIAGNIDNVASKVIDTSKKVLGGRDTKLLSIFSGEQTPVIESALKFPKEADLGIHNGDVALRNAVQTGAETSIKARQSFTQAYGEAFNKLVGKNSGTLLDKNAIIQKFNDFLVENKVSSKKGKLDFTTSDIKTNPGEVSKIQSTAEAIMNWKDFTLQGANELKQLVGKYTKFANEAGGSSKSPFLGKLYDYLDTQIKENLPKTSRKAYTDMNTKFSNTIGLYNEMVDAFNSGDPFTKLSQLFGANKDTLRQVVDFYEQQTGNKIAPIIAGRTLAAEKTAAFGFLNPRSWVDFFVPPKLQAEIVTGYGKLKNQTLKSDLKSNPIESGTTTNATQTPSAIKSNTISPKSTTSSLKVKGEIPTTKIPKSIGSISSQKFGDINLLKGETPTGKSTGFGMTKIEGKYGKGKLNNSTISSIIDKLPVKSESANRIILEDSKFRIIISKDWKGQPTKPWLMNVIIK